MAQEGTDGCRKLKAGGNEEGGERKKRAVKALVASLGDDESDEDSV